MSLPQHPSFVVKVPDLSLHVVSLILEPGLGTSIAFDKINERFICLSN